MSTIEDYVKGIERDLENVQEVEGHPLAKYSILSACKRLADIAKGNYNLNTNSIIHGIEELAKFHAVEVSIVYGDGEESTDKMISIADLQQILDEVRESYSAEFGG